MKTTIAVASVTALAGATDPFVSPLWLQIVLAAIAAGGAMTLAVLAGRLENRLNPVKATADEAHTLSLINL